ncbi:MAG: hypothetical protein RL068_714 [Actinomycetota bacterium]|jgi:DNA processing protein
MQLTQDQELTISYSALSEPGDALAFLIFQLNGPKAIEQFSSGNAKKIWANQLETEAPEYLNQLPALLERFGLRLPKVHTPTLVERAIRWNAKPVFPQDSPGLWARFADLDRHQPYLLWVAGDSQVLDLQANAIVGTRVPTSKGVTQTRKLVKQLEAPVVSGGATGVDYAAHRAALDYKVPTVAYMAGGIDRAYPRENWPLFHEIVRNGGALVSEVPPFTAPTRFRFLNRNRLIAAHSNAVFVVEAGYRSGSRNTANHARACGRDVFALPGPWSDAAAQGCNAMIREGLAEPWHLGAVFATEPSSIQKRVLDSIRDGAADLRDIARESGLSMAAVSSEIKRLKLDGEFIPSVIKM